MSDDLVALGRAAPTATPLPTHALPLTVELPTRYYSRLAVARTLTEYAELATVDMKVEEGAIRLTVTRLDPAAGDVLGELLNHALYTSAIAGPEHLR